MCKSILLVKNHSAQTQARRIRSPRRYRRRAVELPNGRALTRRAATPQALHHFTKSRPDRRSSLTRAKPTPDLGFMARLLSLCSPCRAPTQATRKQYIRRNGPYTLGMSASGSTTKLPYGNLPRLAPGVGLHRSGTDAHNRERAWSWAIRWLGLHAECLVSTARAAAPRAGGRDSGTRCSRLFRSHGGIGLRGRARIAKPR